MCKADCGVFHYNKDLKLCAIFAEKPYDVEFVSDPDWELGYKPFSAIVDGDWTLVFRLQAANGEPSYDAWTDDGRHDDEPDVMAFPWACLSMIRYSSCVRHYRSHILDNWQNINEVKISVIKNSAEVAYIVFDSTGRDRMTWFDETRITQSTWFPGVRDNADLNPYTDIPGYCETGLCRRFYLHGDHSGCQYEWFYLEVYDYDFDYCDWWWSYYLPTTLPTIAYSPSSGKAGFGDERGGIPLGEFADAMAVYVK